MKNFKLSFLLSVISVFEIMSGEQMNSPECKQALEDLYHAAFADSTCMSNPQNPFFDKALMVCTNYHKYDPNTLGAMQAVWDVRILIDKDSTECEQAKQDLVKAVMADSNCLREEHPLFQQTLLACTYYGKVPNKNMVGARNSVYHLRRLINSRVKEETYIAGIEDACDSNLN